MKHASDDPFEATLEDVLTEACHQAAPHHSHTWRRNGVPRWCPGPRGDDPARPVEPPEGERLRKLTDVYESIVATEVVFDWLAETDEVWTIPPSSITLLRELLVAEPDPAGRVADHECVTHGSGPNSEAVDHAIDVLNRIHKADPTVLSALIAHRVRCNETLADDPTVQVGLVAHKDGRPDEYEVGLLGIINGLFGTVPAQSYGYVGAVYEDGGTLTRFRRTDESNLTNEPVVTPARPVEPPENVGMTPQWRLDAFAGQPTPAPQRPDVDAETPEAHAYSRGFTAGRDSMEAEIGDALAAEKEARELAERRNMLNPSATEYVAELETALAAEKEAHAETRAHNAMWGRKYADLMALWERDRTARDAAESDLAAALADRDRLAEALRALKGAWEQVQEAWDAACAALATPQAPTEGEP